MFKNTIYFDNIVALAEGPDLTCHKTGIALRIYRPPHLYALFQIEPKK